MSIEQTTNNKTNMTEQELYNEINNPRSQVHSREQELNLAMPTLMRKVYTWMTLALVITGFTAWGVANSPALYTAILSNSVIMWGMIIAEFVLVIAISGAINRMSMTTATLMFILYSVLNGATFSSIFLVFNMTTIARVFFISAGTFGVTAFYGYTTKKDLSTMGRILFMGLLGIIIATIVNMFLKSTGFDYILSYIGVAIFCGLTAWDSQQIKQALSTQYDVSESAQKVALLGALTLYLDFINLFLYLLRIFGRNDN